MKDNMKKQAQQVVLDMVQLLQGANAGDGMSALDTVLGHLLMIRRKLVESFPADAQAEFRMAMLNIMLVHVLSPYDTATETLRDMAVFSMSYKDTSECTVELKPAAANCADLNAGVPENALFGEVVKPERAGVVEDNAGEPGSVSRRRGNLGTAEIGGEA